MDITGNTDVLIKLFGAAATAVRVGRPEAIAEAVEAYRIFWDTRCQAKFTGKAILVGLSNLKSEWSAFLGREPNASPDDVAAVTTAVTGIHKAIEYALRGKESRTDFADLLNSLHRAATAVVGMSGTTEKSVEHLQKLVELTARTATASEKILSLEGGRQKLAVKQRQRRKRTDKGDMIEEALALLIEHCNDPDWSAPRAAKEILKKKESLKCLMKWSKGYTAEEKSFGNFVRTLNNHWSEYRKNHPETELGKQENS